ncbi:MAG: hypothetical protein ACUVV3_07555 [Dehalococcoidia bacterium]
MDEPIPAVRVQGRCKAESGLFSSRELHTFAVAPWSDADGTWGVGVFDLHSRRPYVGLMFDGETAEALRDALGAVLKKLGWLPDFPAEPNDFVHIEEQNCRRFHSNAWRDVNDIYVQVGGIPMFREVDFALFGTGTPQLLMHGDKQFAVGLYRALQAATGVLPEDFDPDAPSQPRS